MAANFHLREMFTKKSKKKKRFGWVGACQKLHLLVIFLFFSCRVFGLFEIVSCWTILHDILNIFVQIFFGILSLSSIEYLRVFLVFSSSSSLLNLTQNRFLYQHPQSTCCLKTSKAHQHLPFDLKGLLCRNSVTPYRG